MTPVPHWTVSVGAAHPNNPAIQPASKTSAAAFGRTNRRHPDPQRPDGCLLAGIGNMPLFVGAQNRAGLIEKRNTCTPRPGDPVFLAHIECTSSWRIARERVLSPDNNRLNLLLQSTVGRAPTKRRDSWFTRGGARLPRLSKSTIFAGHGGCTDGPQISVGFQQRAGRSSRWR